MFNETGGILKSDVDPSRKLFKSKTWSRQQLFRNVSHNTIDGSYKFPCNTIGGPQMGAPCSFPFVYPDCKDCVQPIDQILFMPFFVILYMVKFSMC